MTLWRKSIMENFYADEEPSENWPCDVRIDGGEIAVSYYVDRQHRVYAGKESGDGHFKLTLSADGCRGQATLHRSPDSDFLEGYWIEDGEFGMWRIQLEDED